MGARPTQKTGKVDLDYGSVVTVFLEHLGSIASTHWWFI